MTEAERLHEGLRTAFAEICGLHDDARFEQRDGYDLLVFPPVPIAQFNGVWPFADTAASELEGALAELETLDLPYSVQVRRGLSPDVAKEAETLGLTEVLTMPGMAVRRDELAATEAGGIAISRVSDSAGLAEAMATAAAGFGAPLSIFEPLYTAEAAALDGIAYFLGRVDGNPVSTSLGLAVNGTVGVFNVATPPEHRGRGFGAAVTWAAAQDGFDNGADLAWLQSSAMGLSVYRGLGFREVETYDLLTRPSAH
jgi:ribosomal protein S18 acetylase RimI-like enzyme